MFHEVGERDVAAAGDDQHSLVLDVRLAVEESREGAGTGGLGRDFHALESRLHRVAYRWVRYGDAAQARRLDRRKGRLAWPPRHQAVADRFWAERHGLDLSVGK